MKNLMIYLLAVWLLVSLTSCGALRTSSINHRDDRSLDAGDYDLEVHKSATQLALDRQQFNLDVDKQSYNDQLSGYSKTDKSKLKIGVIRNRFNRSVRFDVLRGTQLVATYELSNMEQLIIEDLPMGKYTVEYWQYTVKGQYLTNSWPLEITNLANKTYQGSKYHFFISN